MTLTSFFERIRALRSSQSGSQWAAASMRLQNVQALRGLAAAAVFVHNLGYIESKYIGGSTRLLRGTIELQFGVDIFFVLSGFLMAYVTAASAGGWRASSRFLTARVGRIFPAYWTVLAACFVINAIWPGLITDGPASNAVASILLWPQTAPPLLHQAWSLSFELFFYAAFAIVAFAPARFRPAVLGFWAICVAVNLTIRAAFGVGAPLSAFSALASNPLSFEFIVGALLGYALLKMGAALAKTMLGVGVAALTLNCAPIFQEIKHLPIPELWRSVGVGLPCALIVAGLSGLEWRRIFIAPAILTAAGERSYAIYLVHFPIAMILARNTGPDWTSHVAYIVLTLLFTLICAEFVHQIVEAPSQDLVRRLLRKARRV